MVQGTGGTPSISIHALREEGDTSSVSLAAAAFYFYPRPPRGGRPVKEPLSQWLLNFYPRPPRGGRRRPVRENNRDREISIHALREEGDFILEETAMSKNLFLSTPSARRATHNGFFD